MSELKKWLVIVGAAVLCVALLWFGYTLITHPTVTSTTALFVIGCGSVFGGVFVLGTPSGKGRLWGLVLIAVGLYYFARAGEFFDRPWLTRLLGVASWIAAVTVGYVALKLVQAKPVRQQSEDTPEA